MPFLADTGQTAVPFRRRVDVQIAPDWMVSRTRAILHGHVRKMVYFVAEAGLHPPQAGGRSLAVSYRGLASDGRDGIRLGIRRDSESVSSCAG